MNEPSSTLSTSLLSAHSHFENFEFWTSRLRLRFLICRPSNLGMGFFKKLAGLLGFVKGDVHESNDEADDEARVTARSPIKQNGLPRKGFSVPVQVAVDRPHNQIAPLLAPCTSGDGGVQGLSWYAKRLRMDEDGDVAEEFLDEVSPESYKTVAKFEVKYNTRPVIVKRQVLSADGKLQQCVEHQGKLQWV